MQLPSHFVPEKICAATANALKKKQVHQLTLFEESERGTLAENCYYQNTQFTPLHMPLLYTPLENYKSNNKIEVSNTVILSQYYSKKNEIFSLTFIIIKFLYLH